MPFAMAAAIAGGAAASAAGRAYAEMSDEQRQEHADRMRQRYEDQNHPFERCAAEALANASWQRQAAMLANTWPRYRKPWPWPKPPGALRTILCVAVGDASPKRQRIALAAMRRQWPELTRRLLNART